MGKRFSVLVFGLYIVLLITLSSILAYQQKININNVEEQNIILKTQIQQLQNELNEFKTQNEIQNLKLEQSLNDFKLLQNELEEVKKQQLESADLSQVIHLEESERIYFAKLLQRECGAEPFECKMAIAFVVLNRTLSELYPDTITDVINQKGQFEPVGSGSINSAVPNDDCYFAIEMVLNMNYIELLQYFDDIYFFRAATPEKVFGSNTKYAYTLGKTDFYTYK